MGVISRVGSNPTPSTIFKLSRFRLSFFVYINGLYKIRLSTKCGGEGYLGLSFSRMGSNLYIREARLGSAPVLLFRVSSELRGVKKTGAVCSRL